MSQERVWAVVPAAGVGRRMGTDVPKQYLTVAGRPVLAHTLERLCRHPALAGVVAVIGPEDGWWPTVRGAVEPAPLVACGGAERCHSVLNGLDVLGERAAPGDWVLVHDAVRPCVRGADVTRLIDRVRGHAAGGLLATPVRDTMKRAAADGTVAATVERANLWHANTPQMFRLGSLRDALREALTAGVQVTDEAQAMERQGVRPLLVEGHADNIKITRPGNLELAELFIRAQGAAG